MDLVLGSLRRGHANQRALRVGPGRRRAAGFSLGTKVGPAVPISRRASAGDRAFRRAHRRLVLARLSCLRAACDGEIAGQGTDRSRGDRCHGTRARVVVLSAAALLSEECGALEPVRLLWLVAGLASPLNGRADATIRAVPFLLVSGGPCD